MAETIIPPRRSTPFFISCHSLSRLYYYYLFVRLLQLMNLKYTFLDVITIAENLWHHSVCECLVQHLDGSIQERKWNVKYRLSSMLFTKYLTNGVIFSHRKYRKRLPSARRSTSWNILAEQWMQWMAHFVFGKGCYTRTEIIYYLAVSHSNSRMGLRPSTVSNSIEICAAAATRRSDDKLLKWNGEMYG